MNQRAAADVALTLLSGAGTRGDRTRAEEQLRDGADGDGPYRLPTRPPHSRFGNLGLPPAVEGLLLDVVADGFVLYCCGHQANPTALVASYEWERCVDLITIRSFERVTSARIPSPYRGHVDIFAPEVVVWAYEGPPQLALRAMLNLVHPAHPEAPGATYSAPPSLHISRAEQRPLTIRPPSPIQAGARATRLAASMLVGSHR